jgi:hypothetical protein
MVAIVVGRFFECGWLLTVVDNLLVVLDRLERKKELLSAMAIQTMHASLIK